MSENTLKLRLHIKVLKDPDGNLVNTHENIDEMVRGMKEVYSTALIEVEEITREILENSELLADMQLTPCNGILPLSPEHEELFNFRNGVLNGDIVAYFVRSMPSCNCDGCASHPRDKHGVMVARGASKWTLAHEVGHLFLGFDHEDEVTNLMIGTTTHHINDPPPDLSEEQKTQMVANGKLKGLITEHHAPPITIAAPFSLPVDTGEPSSPIQPLESRPRSRRIPLAQVERSPVVTMEHVRAAIYSDDPDLEQVAAILGADALPHLEEIIREEHPRLAPKALNLAALIKDERTINIFRLATVSKDPVIRLTAAYNLRHLNLSAVADLLLLFLNDRDLGVRKFALLAMEKYVPTELQSKIEYLRRTDPSAYIRQISDQTLVKISSPGWWRNLLNRLFN
ncbi:MAG: HEAT repeat domain-containing protein [Blastocatellia bacterium]